PSAANISSFSSSLVVMNVGITTAQVSLKAYGVNGAVLGQTLTPLFISPNGVLSFENVLQTLGVTNNYGPIEINSLNSVPLVTTFEGYIRLESSQPIFGWASIIDNATDDPGFAEGKGAGSTALLVESVANMGSFKSSLVIVNMGGSSALVDILSRDATGQINGDLRSIVIPARGYFSSDNI